MNIETFVFQFSIVSWKQSWFKGLAEIILNLVDQNQTSFSLGLWAGFCTQTLPFGEEENKTFHHLEQQQQQTNITKNWFRVIGEGKGYQYVVHWSVTEILLNMNILIIHKKCFEHSQGRRNRREISFTSNDYVKTGQRINWLFSESAIRMDLISNFASEQCSLNKVCPP